MKIVLLGVLFFSGLLPLEAKEKQLSELDKEIIKFFREGEIGADGADYPDLETYHEKLSWYWGQGQKARPALMYLLTEVYEGDFANMSRAMDALWSMDGDRADILAYVRERLPNLRDPEKLQGKYGHIQVSLGVLGRFGYPVDMELIRSFLNHPDVLVRSSAMTQERLLQSRIDAGEFEKSPTRREKPSNATEVNHQESPDHGADRIENSDGEKIENHVNIGLILVVLAAFLAATLFLWKKLGGSCFGGGPK
jgi:hypothetical protein